MYSILGNRLPCSAGALASPPLSPSLLGRNITSRAATAALSRRRRCCASFPGAQAMFCRRDRLLARFVLFATWLAAGAEKMEPDITEALCTAGEQCRESPTPQRVHHWPNVRGHLGSYGVSPLPGPLAAPGNLSGPSWRWPPLANRFLSVVVGGPVIDNEGNLYIVDLFALHKFNAQGRILWAQKPPTEGATFPDGPSLMDEKVFASTTLGELCAFDSTTGELVWVRKYFEKTGGDSKYVTSHDGVVVIGTDSANLGGGGSKHVLGIDGLNGSLLWAFSPDTPTWNTMGMFTDADTVVFQDFDSKVYCLGLHNGTLLWKSGGHGGKTFSDGGTIIGQNGVVYAVSTKGNAISTPFSGGGLHAYRLSDGVLLWEKELPHPVLTWPVVAKLGQDSKFTVIVCPGPLGGLPWKLSVVVCTGYGIPVMLAASLCWTLCARCKGGWAGLAKKLSICCLLLFAIVAALTANHVLQYRAGFPGVVTALDAETGELQWSYELPVWRRVAARGDEEGVLTRLRLFPDRPVCLPAMFSSPSVDGAGVLYIGHMSGMLFGIKDWNADGTISSDEVSAFDAEAAFLHSGPAFAPGMFAFTTCDSLFVWRI